jgi:deoxycytidine triphosphate deaminase
MSVIPLNIEGDHVTVVLTEQQFRYDGHALLILNADVAQLRPPDSTGNPGENRSNASYDLRVGGAWRDHRDPKEQVRSLGADDEILLLPRGAVLIETEEQVWLPHSMFGYVVPKVGLLQRGVSNTLSKIDPGYHDYLVVTLFNLGQATIHLKRGRKFCALVVHDVGAGVRPYTGVGKRILGKQATGKFPTLFNHIEARSGLISIIVSLIALAIVIIQEFVRR